MLVNEANVAGLFRSYNVIFNEAIRAVAPLWPKLAMLVPSAASEEDYGWLMDFPGMQEWVDERIIRDLSAFSWTIRNKNYEATVELDRNLIEDDRYGLLNPKIQQLAQAAIKHRDRLIAELLDAAFDHVCYDGQYMIDDDHPLGDSTWSNDGAGSSNDGWFVIDQNQALKPLVMQVRKEPEMVSVIDPTASSVFMRRKFLYGVDDRKNVGYGLPQLIYGSKDTLTIAHFTTAISTMMGLTDVDGNKLGVLSGGRPLLVVPPDLMADALQLLNDDPIWVAGTAYSNPHKGTFDLQVNPYLA